MMTVLDLLKIPELTGFSQKFRELFPRFFSASLDIHVAPWLAYSHLEQYDRFDQSGFPISQVLGVSFPDARIVSFRTMPPDPGLLVHELGHVVFNIRSEPPWSSTYSGAEILFWLFYREILSPEDLEPDRTLEALARFFVSFSDLPHETRADILQHVVSEVPFAEKSLFNLYSVLGVLKPESFLELPLTPNPNSDPPVNLDREPDELFRTLLSGALMKDPAHVLVLECALKALVKLF